MANPYSVVLVSVPDKKTANKVGRGLVEARFAACVSMVPEVTSIYRWQGKVEEASELLLVIKTRTALVPELSEFVRKLHPHSVPEIIALPIHHGHRSYLDWIGASTIFTKPRSSEPARSRFAP